MSKNDCENNPQNKPEFEMFSMIDCYILLPPYYVKPERASHIKIFNDVIEKLHEETISGEEIKKFFGKSAEICGDYTIEKDFIKKHKNNPEKKLVKYDANPSNDEDRILVPIQICSPNFFTVNNFYESKGGEV